MKASFLTGVCLTAALLLPATSWANFWLHRSASPVVAYYSPIYFTPLPVVTVPVPWPPILVAPPAVPVTPSPAFQPVTVAPAPLYAQPTAAPPSGTVEPPLASPPPSGAKPQATDRIQSRKPSEGAYDIHYVSSPTSGRLAGQDCAVMFWNLAGRDLTLYVEGQAHRLPARQSLKMNLSHDFRWNTENSLPHRQQVPAQESGLEIVLRE